MDQLTERKSRKLGKLATRQFGEMEALGLYFPIAPLPNRQIAQLLVSLHPTFAKFG